MPRKEEPHLAPRRVPPWVAPNIPKTAWTYTRVGDLDVPVLVPHTENAKRRLFEWMRDVSDEHREVFLEWLRLFQGTSQKALDGIRQLRKITGDFPDLSREDWARLLRLPDELAQAVRTMTALFETVAVNLFDDAYKHIPVRQDGPSKSGAARKGNTKLFGAPDRAAITTTERNEEIRKVVEEMRKTPIYRGMSPHALAKKLVKSPENRSS
jgi:hypothetical protein